MNPGRELRNTRDLPAGIKRYAGGKLNRKWKVVKVGHSSRSRGSDGG